MRNRQNLYLIIDDDYMIRFIHAKMIESMESDARIQSCSNGLEALDFLSNREKWLDANLIILLDLNMPVMNGLSFLENLGDTSHASIYIISSSVSESDRQKAASYGVKDYLTKPVMENEMRKIVGQLSSPDFESSYVL